MAEGRWACRWIELKRESQRSVSVRTRELLEEGAAAPVLGAVEGAVVEGAVLVLVLGADIVGIGKGRLVENSGVGN